MNDAKPDAANGADANADADADSNAASTKASTGAPAKASTGAPAKASTGAPAKAPTGASAKGSRTSKADSGTGDKPARSSADTLRSVRSGVASAVWLLAVVAALILAAGALVIALDFNPRNGVVSFLTDTADRLNLLGELKTFEGGRSADSKHSALVKTVLVNWGIAALAYLIVGKVLDRLIRP